MGLIHEWVNRMIYCWGVLTQVQSFLANTHFRSSRYCTDYWINWFIESICKGILIFVPILLWFLCGLVSLVCWSLTSLYHNNGHIETMPAREFNPFTALTRIRSRFLRTQWSTSNHQRVDMTTPHTAQPSGLACGLVSKSGLSYAGLTRNDCKYLTSHKTRCIESGYHHLGN